MNIPSACVVIIVRNYLHTCGQPRIPAAAGIRGQRLFSFRGWRLFEGGVYSKRYSILLCFEGWLCMVQEWSSASQGGSTNLAGLQFSVAKTLLRVQHARLTLAHVACMSTKYTRPKYVSCVYEQMKRVRSLFRTHFDR